MCKRQPLGGFIFADELTTNSYTTRSALPKVLLVGVDFGLPHFDAELGELGLLAQTAGYEPVAHLSCKRRAPDARLFVGSGKADEIKELDVMQGST